MLQLWAWTRTKFGSGTRSQQYLIEPFILYPLKGTVSRDFRLLLCCLPDTNYIWRVESGTLSLHFSSSYTHSNLLSSSIFGRWSRLGLVGCPTSCSAPLPSSPTSSWWCPSPSQGQPSSTGRPWLRGNMSTMLLSTRHDNDNGDIDGKLWRSLTVLKYSSTRFLFLTETVGV